MSTEVWTQNYDPLRNAFLSTTLSAVPVVVLLSSIAIFKMRIHFAALLGLAVALAVAVFAYHMPVRAAAATTAFGAAYGLFPIGWIILNLIFLYQLTVRKGLFEILRGSLASLAPDAPDGWSFPDEGGRMMGPRRRVDDGISAPHFFWPPPFGSVPSRLPHHFSTWYIHDSGVSDPHVTAIILRSGSLGS